MMVVSEVPHVVAAEEKSADNSPASYHAPVFYEYGTVRNLTRTNIVGQFPDGGLVAVDDTLLGDTALGLS